MEKSQHNTVVETSLLAMCIMSGDILAQARLSLSPDDFWKTANRIIFEALVDLSERGSEIDFPVLFDALISSGTLEDAGGSSYLADLGEAYLTASRSGEYIKIIQRDSLRRKLLQVGNQVLGLGGDENIPVCEGIATATELLSAIRGNVQADDMGYELAPALLAAFDGLGRNEAGIGMGYPSTDLWIGGLRPGCLMTVGARTGVGKTTYALNVALHVARAGHRVLFFSLEMPRLEIARRLISIDACLSSEVWNESSKNLPTEAVIDAEESIVRLKEINLEICDKASSVDEVCRIAEGANTWGDIRLLVVDYLQILTGSRKSESYRLEVAGITRTLKQLAMRQKLAIMVLSQLNRKIEDRQSGLPRLSDLMESGSIEADSDVVILLARSGKEDTRGGKIIIGKNRSGRTGCIDAYFDMEKYKIAEMTSLAESRTV